MGCEGDVLFLQPKTTGRLKRWLMVLSVVGGSGQRLVSVQGFETSFTSRRSTRNTGS